MKTIVVVLAVLAVAVAGPAPQPQPGPEPQPAAPSAQASSASDQESQASESVSKRGAARLTPVSGNSIVDNTVSSAPQSLQQLQPLQPQLTTYSSSQQQPQLTAYSSQPQPQPQPQPQQQPQQQPLYAPHPYSFVAPQHQPSFFQYQPSLPALPPLLHSKYHAPSKQHVLQYVPQPYFQVPQYQAPLMYLIPQPQPHQAQPHHAQPAAGQQQQQSAGQPEQAVHHPQQPQQYVMVLSAPAAAPAPVAASGFQYFNHPLLAQQPQQLITFYAGPQQGQVAQPQAHLHQPQHQLHHIQLTQPQQPQMHQPQTRFYPEQQQLVFQSPQAEGPSAQNDGPPHFVQKQQNNQGPVGLEAPAPPTPASLVGTYGARVQHQQQHQQPHQHAYKTIIKA